MKKFCEDCKHNKENKCDKNKTITTEENECEAYKNKYDGKKIYGKVKFLKHEDF